MEQPLQNRDIDSQPEEQSRARHDPDKPFIMNRKGADDAS